MADNNDYQVGYILKKANSDQYHCWVIYDDRMDMYVLRHQYHCILIDDYLFKTKNQLRTLIENHTLEAVPIKYKIDEHFRIIELEDKTYNFTRWRFWSMADHCDDLDFKISLRDC